MYSSDTEHSPISPLNNNNNMNNYLNTFNKSNFSLTLRSASKLHLRIQSPGNKHQQQQQQLTNRSSSGRAEDNRNRNSLKAIQSPSKIN